jgi:glycine/D-amino acid oxidase-like deaminating enzyme
MKINKSHKQTIAICGAGIAGIATAYYLSIAHNDFNIVLIDKQQPLSFTTSKSGENFRDFWPQKCMRDLSIQSIHLMNELRNRHGADSFKMTFSGYNFVSCRKEQPIFASDFDDLAERLFEETTEKNHLLKQYPYLGKDVARVVKIKNAGNIDVNAMGSLMLREAKIKGVQVIKGEILSISQGHVRYEMNLDSNVKISADKIVIATGPFINQIGQMLDLYFPIENTLQRKFIIPDPKGIIPRDMPFTIYADPQFLDWSKEEIAFFKSDSAYHWLLEQFPGGLHIKPEGEGIKMGWAFNRVNELPKWERSSLDLFPQVVLKGASRLIPQLAEYEHNIPAPLIEYAGYYTRTKENWPLIGPTDVSDVFVIGALSGFGTMTGCAAGQLCAQYILNDNAPLPEYAPYFHPNRYENSKILQKIIESQSDGQL